MLWLAGFSGQGECIRNSRVRRTYPFGDAPLKYRRDPVSELTRDARRNFTRCQDSLAHVCTGNLRQRETPEPRKYVGFERRDICGSILLVLPCRGQLDVGLSGGLLKSWDFPSLSPSRNRIAPRMNMPLILDCLISCHRKSYYRRAAKSQLATSTIYYYPLNP